LIDELTAENQKLKTQLQELGALEHTELQTRTQVLRDDVAKLDGQIREEEQKLRVARTEIVETEDALILQEVGVYQFRHPLDSATQYKDAIATVKEQMKAKIKDKTAVHANYGFTFNNSAAKGKTFVNDFVRLMLRAYNAEAENCIRVLKAGTLPAAEKRLQKTAEVVEKLGRMVDVRISPEYHALRKRELELTADYLMKLQEEKEAARAERERLREEEKARAEYRREQEKLQKERSHFANAIEALRLKGDLVGVAELEAKVAAVDQAIEGLKDREANIRAGYVYVISNLGALGERMVKIGMTRRLEPMDRVTELGDASVPFRYDVHALFFAEDAVGIEASLHRELEHARVNKVNLRREFFYATPSEVRELLMKHAGNLLDYVEEPDANEYWQSQGQRKAAEADLQPV
jgi:hypothetical protein